MQYLRFLTVLFFVFAVNSYAEYNPATHTNDLLMVSTEQEVAMGRGAARQVEESKEIDISRDPRDIKRIREIGKKIAAVCDRQEVDYYFYVITYKKQENDKNAVCLPGGYVYVFKALFDDLTDDELAFVLAHEVGHVVARHHVKQYQAAMAANLLTVAVAVVPAKKDDDFVTGTIFAIDQLFSAYSREDEFKADELAVQYTKSAGFDPKAGITVMEKLYKESKKHIEPYSYFRTHPYTSARIAHIRNDLHLPMDASDYINLKD